MLKLSGFRRLLSDVLVPYVLLPGVFLPDVLLTDISIKLAGE